HLRHLDLAAKEAIVMHPGPMNRGIEIASEIADGGRSLILDQVTNGVAVRMAVLYLLAGAGKSQNGTKRPRIGGPTVREGSRTDKNGSSVKEKRDRTRGSKPESRNQA